MHLGEEWYVEGERVSDSFNARRAIRSDNGRLGYLKVLNDGTPEDPWQEQFANEEIASRLAGQLGIPCVEAVAGTAGGERGAVVVFTEGRKLAEITLAGFMLEPTVVGASNRQQIGTMLAFDCWTLNVDRGAHNVFVVRDGGRPRLHLIDHGHILYLPRDKLQWSGQSAIDAIGWEPSGAAGLLDRRETTSELLNGNCLRRFATPGGDHGRR